MGKNKEEISIYNAKSNNLKGIDLKIPRNELVVITGLSGSGKSSLAFDTIYAEGQRRYIETFSAYARQFLNKIDRPDVDKIDGLSPVIAIEQKTVNKSPRSTVGTTTEIYDFLRLLFSRCSDAYSHKTNKKMVSYSSDKIFELIKKTYNEKKIILLAPVIKSRKGSYQELFQNTLKKGYVQCRVDGEIIDINEKTILDRYKIHDIEIVVDKLDFQKNNFPNERFKSSLNTCFYLGNKSVLIMEHKTGETRYFSQNLVCEDTGVSYQIPEPNNFSFNSPRGACTKCKGIGKIKEVDIKKLIPDKNKSIDQGGIELIGGKNSWVYKQIKHISEKLNFSLKEPIKKISKKGLDAILYGLNDSLKIENKSIGVNYDYLIKFDGIVNFLENQLENYDSIKIRRWAKNYFKDSVCENCNGSRLKKESLFFKIDGKNINDIVNMEISELSKWIKNLPNKLNEKQKIISKDILKEISERIYFMENVGLEYLNLNRTSKSLSGGESQRIRLASQIGSNLSDVLYILDEPSIGLHQSDNDKLIKTLVNLKNLGNSVIVVEHDKEMILNANHIIDIGPSAGKNGGAIVFSGTVNELLKSDTITSKYLSEKLKIKHTKNPRPGNGKNILLKGCKGNNLKNIDVIIPLNVLTVVTGVSGSGKSTLINETLYPLIHNKIFKSEKNVHDFDKIIGLENIDKIVNISQSPIGRTTRSNPATYCGVFSEIRNLFSNLNESKIRGYKAGRFSFNVSGGRCEECKGGGLRQIEMKFLPDVYIECESCMSKRFNRETLEIKYKGKSINDVLNMSIDDATTFFEHIPKIYNKLSTIKNVGLGYLSLGQQSTTLSGGEAQRIKLASELSKRDTGKTLFVLDEPTTGLHFEDIRVLLETIKKLIDRGNTVIIIEHNLDVIKTADYIIDLGPKGGNEGGEIIFQGYFNKFLNSKTSLTAKFLKKELT